MDFSWAVCRFLVPGSSGFEVMKGYEGHGGLGTTIANPLLDFVATFMLQNVVGFTYICNFDDFR